MGLFQLEHVEENRKDTFGFVGALLQVTEHFEENLPSHVTRELDLPVVLFDHYNFVKAQD